MTNRILITRPTEGAREFAATLEQEGFRTITEPMIVIAPVSHRAPEVRPYDGILFTSANAVRLFGGRTNTRVPAFCVGRGTAAEAHKRDFRKTIPCGKNVTDMAAYLKARKPKRYLYVRGERISFPLAEELRGAGSTVDEVIVYDAVAVDNFTPACISAIKGGAIDAVTFFSARTAENFGKLVEKHDLVKDLSKIKALSISEEALKSVQAYGWAGTYAAAKPDISGMTELVKRICQKT